MFKRIIDFVRKMKMISVPEGSMEQKWGMPLIRHNGWDYYDVHQVNKMEVKKNENRKIQ